MDCGTSVPSERARGRFDSEVLIDVQKGSSCQTVRRGKWAADALWWVQSGLNQRMGKVTNGHKERGRSAETRYRAHRHRRILARFRQNTHSPKGSVSECEQEPGADHASADCALAPTLEHGDQSHQEKDHRHEGETFDPHSGPYDEPATRILLAEGRGSRWEVTAKWCAGSARWGRSVFERALSFFQRTGL